MKMHSSSDKEIESMESEVANPKNALGIIDGQSIVEVSATALSGIPEALQEFSCFRKITELGPTD